MAIVWRGMTGAERIALTGAMTRSGDLLEWAGTGLAGPVQHVDMVVAGRQLVGQVTGAVGAVVVHDQQVSVWH